MALSLEETLFTFGADLDKGTTTILTFGGLVYLSEVLGLSGCM